MTGGGSTNVLDAALGYLAAGLSPIPVRADGTKAPVEREWQRFGDAAPDLDQLEKWFSGRERRGVGIACGPASGNLAVLDFETAPAFDEWLAALSADARGATLTCPLARTGGGGAHLYVRLPESVKGVVLARRLVGGRVRTKIEFRGHGQQVLAPGCPAECHPDRRLYEWIRPGWTTGNEDSGVTPWETWYEWLQTAADRTEVRPKEAPPDTRPNRRWAQADDPGRDFNHRGTWAETGLFEAGWTWSVELGDDRGLCRRPDKKVGTSGSLGICQSRANGWPLFHCFTSSSDVFKEGGNYDRFGVFARLKHRNDFSAAASALFGLGYGKREKQPFRKEQPANGAPGRAGGAGPDGPPPPPTNGAPPALPLLYYADIVPALDAADFVERLLIDGAMTVVYGDSNTGKTFFVLDLALHVSAGLPWRGREVERRGVLYLALEGSHGIRNRVAAFKLANVANEADLAFAVVPVPLNLRAADGDTLRVIEAAKAAAERLTVPVGLVVVDTLSRAMAGGNENAPEDMTAFIAQVDLIRQALPAHLIVVHHCGKDAARGARGHSSLRAATDTEIEVSRDHLARTSLARVTKQRDLELGDEFAFRLHPVELGKDRRGRVVTSCVVHATDGTGAAVRDERQAAAEREKKQREQERNRLDERDVLLVIDAERAKGLPGASLSWIGDKAQCSERRAEAAVLRLYERGELVKVGPFQRPSGNGAQVTVKEGYGRPERTGSDPDD